MSKYNNYDIIKAGAYAKNASLYKWLVEHMPRILLKRLFPVIGFIQAEPEMYVLDIGSGSGLYAYMLRTRFCSQCIEVEPYMTNLYDAGDQVIRDDIFHLPTYRKFNIILLIDVLEHLTDQEIDVLFASIKDILSPMGKVYVKVPNASSLAGLESSVGDLTHVQHFNAISLSSLAHRHQFQLTKITGIGPNLTLKRVLFQLISIPFDILMRLHLRARGCSSVLLSPAIIAELQYLR